MLLRPLGAGRSFLCVAPFARAELRYVSFAHATPFFPAAPTGPFFPAAMLIRLCDEMGVHGISCVDGVWTSADATSSGAGAGAVVSAPGANSYGTRSQLVADMFSCILVPVPPFVVDDMSSSCYRPHLGVLGRGICVPPNTASGGVDVGASAGAGATTVADSASPASSSPSFSYWRIADRPRWSAFPGLREALASRHRMSTSGLDGSEVLNLLDRGSSGDAVEMRMITDDAHPLRKVVTGSLAGAFARRAIAPGEVLGIYPGTLVSVSELDPFLAALPLEQQRAAWSYDIETGFPEYSFHGAAVRNVMCTLNDFHGIEPNPSLGASVRKVPVRLAGVLPLVLFVASRAVPAHAEVTLSYGPAWVKTFTAYFPAAKEFFRGGRGEPSLFEQALSFGFSCGERTRAAKKAAVDDHTVTARAQEALRLFSEKVGANKQPGLMRAGAADFASLSALLTGGAGAGSAGVSGSSPPSPPLMRSGVHSPTASNSSPPADAPAHGSTETLEAPAADCGEGGAAGTAATVSGGGAGGEACYDGFASRSDGSASEERSALNMSATASTAVCDAAGSGVGGDPRVASAVSTLSVATVSPTGTLDAAASLPATGAATTGAPVGGAGFGGGSASDPLVIEARGDPFYYGAGAATAACARVVNGAHGLLAPRAVTWRIAAETARAEAAEANAMREREEAAKKERAAAKLKRGEDARASVAAAAAAAAAAAEAAEKARKARVPAPPKVRPSWAYVDVDDDADWVLSAGGLNMSALALPTDADILYASSAPLSGRTRLGKAIATGAIVPPPPRTAPAPPRVKRERDQKKSGTRPSGKRERAETRPRPAKKLTPEEREASKMLGWAYVPVDDAAIAKEEHEAALLRSLPKNVRSLLKDLGPDQYSAAIEKAVAAQNEAAVRRLAQNSGVGAGAGAGAGSGPLDANDERRSGDEYKDDDGGERNADAAMVGPEA